MSRSFMNVYLEIHPNPGNTESVSINFNEIISDV